MSDVVLNRRQSVRLASLQSTPSSEKGDREQKAKRTLKRARAVSPKQRRAVTPTSSPEATVDSQYIQENGGLKQLPIPPTTESLFDNDFEDLQVSPQELRPSATLTIGQCFHWKAVGASTHKEGSRSSAWGSHNATEWMGTLRISESGESLVVVIRETPETTLFRVLLGPPNFAVKKFLRRYFQLEEPLGPLYQRWSEADERLARIAECIPGVRIIDQCPWECLVSFLCSSNNNIPRITKMLSAIRREYGEPLLKVGDEALFSFPSFTTLSKRATSTDLREKCGMGYRAKYLLETMKILDSLGGEKFLQELRDVSDPIIVQEKLIQFCGVGRKVADCIALFSMKQCDAIPVDVHVWNIACRDYDDEGQLRKVKSLTPTVYQQVGEIFRSSFPLKSGWAHTLLFVAELPSFRPALPSDMVEEMDKFRDKQRAAKAGKRAKRE